MVVAVGRNGMTLTVSELKSSAKQAAEVNNGNHAALGVQGHVNGAKRNGEKVNGERVNGTGINGSQTHGKRKVRVAFQRTKVNGSNGAGLNGTRVNGHGGLASVAKQSGKSRETRKKTSGAGGRSLVAQDRLLVERCLTGEPSAWSQIYDRFHGSLLASVRAFLGRAGHDIHLVDEISARVWYSLVRNGFELLAKFDPARGCRLSTFLSVLGKSEARLLLRSERRRKTRECVASRPEIEHADATGGALTDDEFLATLSPRERAFYLEILVATDRESGDAEYSRQNQWQLRHRVRKKLEQFLE